MTGVSRASRLQLDEIRGLALYKADRGASEDGASRASRAEVDEVCGLAATKAEHHSIF
jgi:hypothetical protein